LPPSRKREGVILGGKGKKDLQQVQIFIGKNASKVKKKSNCSNTQDFFLTGEIFFPHGEGFLFPVREYFVPSKGMFYSQ
jgi:hypothetical protein